MSRKLRLLDLSSKKVWKLLERKRRRNKNQFNQSKILL